MHTGLYERGHKQAVEGGGCSPPLSTWETTRELCGQSGASQLGCPRSEQPHSTPKYTLQ